MLIILKNMDTINMEVLPILIIKNRTDVVDIDDLKEIIQIYLQCVVWGINQDTMPLTGILCSNNNNISDLRDFIYTCNVQYSQQPINEFWLQRK